MKQKNESHIKKEIVTILILVIASILFIGCDFKRKNAIGNYHGDGDIKYLKAPPLGVSGVEIKMPPFDLSKPFDAEYSLNGIPPTPSYYIVYLVVPDPCPIKLVSQGSLKIEIFYDGILIKKLSISSLSEITNNQRGMLNRFYFYNEGELRISESNRKVTISVKSENAQLSNSVIAYFLIETGGTK